MPDFIETIINGIKAWVGAELTKLRQLVTSTRSIAEKAQETATSANTAASTAQSTATTAQSTAAAAVKTVNGVEPDGAGNVDATEVTLGRYTLKIGDPYDTGYGFAVKSSSGDVLSRLTQDSMEIFGNGTAKVRDDNVEIGTSSKYIRLNANAGSTSAASISLQDDSNNYVHITADGIVGFATKVIRLGSAAAVAHIVRNVKGPEQDLDAANKKYVDDTVQAVTALPNPNKLTFSGASYAEYDGSAPVAVSIPDAYSKAEIDAIMGRYIDDINTLIGGDS